jgi:hypothetical protein
MSRARVASLPGSDPQPTKEATVDEVRIPPAGDPFTAQPRDDGDLYRAACEALRLLQDRQQHAPEEHLYPRERKVLRQLREAIRAHG